MTFTSSISLKGPPNSLNEITFGNFWVPAILPLAISDDLQKNIESSGKYLKQNIGSFDLLGLDFIGNIAN